MGSRPFHEGADVAAAIYFTAVLGAVLKDVMVYHFIGFERKHIDTKNFQEVNSERRLILSFSSRTVVKCSPFFSKLLEGCSMVMNVIVVWERSGGET